MSVTDKGIAYRNGIEVWRRIGILAWNIADKIIWKCFLIASFLFMVVYWTVLGLTDRALLWDTPIPLVAAVGFVFCLFCPPIRIKRPKL